MTEPRDIRLAEVAALLRRSVGLRLDPLRDAALRTALERASADAGVPQETFVDRLLSGESPLQPLVEQVTVGETYFFRDQAQWSFVERTVLAPFARGPQDRRFRAWSAGCSTGEEPFTLAVLLVDRGLAARSRILATDVSSIALHRARRAEFSLWSFRGGIDPRLRRLLVEREGRFALDAAVKDLVTFRELNLASPFTVRDLGGDPLDLILCRNVLIYLASEVVKEVARRLFDSLAPGAWLVTGASDPLLSRHAPFRIESGPHGIAYQRPAVPRRSGVASTVTKTITAPRPVTAARTVAPSRRAGPATGREAIPAPAAEPRPDPRSPGACDLCRTLLDAGRREDALRAVDEAIGRDRLDPELQLMRALVLTELGELAEAERACRRAVYLDRTSPFPQFFLAMLRLQGGDRASAASGLRTAIALCGRRPPDEPVPLSSGLTIAELASAARFQLDALAGERGSTAG